VVTDAAQRRGILPIQRTVHQRYVPQKFGEKSTRFLPEKRIHEGLQVLADALFQRKRIMAAFMEPFERELEPPSQPADVGFTRHQEVPGQSKIPMLTHPTSIDNGIGVPRNNDQDAATFKARNQPLQKRDRTRTYLKIADCCRSDNNVE
jgi:hypothetical protein